VTNTDVGQLAPGWVLTTVGEVSLVNPRSYLVPPRDDECVSFVPMAAVEAASGQMHAKEVKPYQDVRRGYTPFAEGDVLFAKITPCMENGKIAVAQGLEGGRGCGSTEFHVIRLFEGVSNRLMMYYLLQDEFHGEARKHMTGSAGQLRVPAQYLVEALFPLPPLAEQHRIVAEIEKQFTRLDASVAALKRAQANLERYWASELKAACEGKLVPQDPADEPASVLLERIRAERATSPNPLRLRRGLKIPLAAGGEGPGGEA